MSLKNLVNKTVVWGYDKGICHAQNSDKQLLKTVEEVGELYEGLMTNNREEVIDAIGDALVTQILFIECLTVKGGDYNTTPADLIDSASASAEPMSNFIETVTAELLATNVSIAVSKVASSYLKREQNKELLFTNIFDLCDMLSSAALQVGSTAEECLQVAYDVISKRTGNTVDGVFLKDAANDI